MDKQWHTHFHPDERAFVDRAAEWIERAADQHAVKVTDFLDPRQAVILESIANRFAGEAALHLDGGYEGAERRRAAITPSYRDPADVDTGIRVLAIHPTDDKFLELDHGDYMGAVLGLGIKRDKIGDIHVREDGCHCLVAAEIAEFLDLHLNQVHRAKVRTEILPKESLQTAPTDFQELQFTVASMRLDGILGDVWRLSRAKALVPIKGGRVRVNWKAEEDPSRSLKEGDVVSVKGFGRFKLLEVEGVTKKGRIRVRAGIYK